MQRISSYVNKQNKTPLTQPPPHNLANRQPSCASLVDSLSAVLKLVIVSSGFKFQAHPRGINLNQFKPSRQNLACHQCGQLDQLDCSLVTTGDCGNIELFLSLQLRWRHQFIHMFAAKDIVEVPRQSQGETVARSRRGPRQRSSGNV